MHVFLDPSLRKNDAPTLFEHEPYFSPRSDKAQPSTKLARLK